MKISDDTLLLYHWQEDLNEAERTVVEQALHEDAALRARLAQLMSDLSRLAPTGIVLPEGAMARWGAALNRAASTPQRASRRSRWAWGRAWSFGLAGMATAALLFSLQPAPPAPAPSPGAERLARWQLDDTRRAVQALAGLDPARRGLALDALLAQHRSQVAAAERAGAPALARKLRALTPVLAGLRNDTDEAAALAQLGFEIQVIQAQLGPRGDAAWRAREIAL